MGRKKKGKIDKLAQDMIQRQKDGFGVHYGAWRAAQYEKNKGMTTEKPKGYKHTCLHCGKEFYSKVNRGRKYCCEQCKNEHYRTQKPKVSKPIVGNPVEKTCPICGKDFLAKNNRYKYCCEVCAYTGQKQRMKAFREQQLKEAKANG